MTRPIILASQSKGRQDMLRGAGVPFNAMPAHIDERGLTDQMLENDADFTAIAQMLADEKAKVISQDHPDALVIGSDQVLEFDGQLLSKAATDFDAINRLRAMSGKAHRLISAVTIARGGEIIWQHHDQAILTCHDFDDAFLMHYQSCAGQALTKSVGGYWLEDVGSWLFQSIEGNYFTILGMPLLPLLGYLRIHHNIIMDKPA